jgi:hypothetical protein
MTDMYREKQIPALDEWFGYGNSPPDYSYNVRRHHPIVQGLCWVGSLAAFGALVYGEGYVAYQIAPEESRHIVSEVRDWLEQLPGKLTPP